MSADTDSEMRQLNTRIPKVLDEEIDDTWQARGFASKSEFVRARPPGGHRPGRTLRGNASNPQGD
ncbi:MAG: ribbon-helix-helix domain-containing protein [Halobacteriales archaeon]|nr:ribbon-helix-helix domain-containing protein [Halobacteriales archaeon]